ncbi:DUF411 domain-containing protein [Sediminicoccus rosea]|uniref:DUF411 domain-containing protein n=1 Tax=Sediminicoccus rosea TaxID=1225128 RepID=A0ABZ0PDF3_9PROT|nr:DUF411 domain-containing protein [Sediminicoccus rosea]WPB83733.1 DUF411 domain-containing protein [Sediminicoccus rosea]
MTSRRSLLTTALLTALPIPVLAQRVMRISVWRDPNCGCCTGWVAHLRAEGFTVSDQVVPSVAPVRRRLGTPADLLSCHAGEIEGFVLEGHVPAAAIRRLLVERPEGVRGLAVPEMPVGSPGMEVPGAPVDSYDVIAFGSGPHRPFMRFNGPNPA